MGRCERMIRETMCATVNLARGLSSGRACLGWCAALCVVWMAGLSLAATDEPAANPANSTSAAAVTKFNEAAEPALQAMQKKAESMKMKGAALVAFIPGEKTAGWVSRMLVVGEFVKGKDNVPGVAYSKAAEMADTLKNSGSGERPPLKGEYGYKGGVIRKIDGGYVLAAFSGGRAEDDVKVSQEGLEQLAQLIEAAAPGK